MIDAAGVLFDPERPVTLNRRLTQCSCLYGSSSSAASLRTVLWLRIVTCR